MKVGAACRSLDDWLSGRLPDGEYMRSNHQTRVLCGLAAQDVSSAISLFALVLTVLSLSCNVPCHSWHGIFHSKRVCSHSWHGIFHSLGMRQKEEFFWETATADQVTPVTRAHLECAKVSSLQCSCHSVLNRLHP